MVMNRYLKRSPFNRRTEYDEHCAVIGYRRVRFPYILLTIAPNGLKLSMPQAMKFKRMGYTAGTPDLLIFEPRGNYNGLLIEMKREHGGQVSPAQRERIGRAAKRGYCTAICNGFDEAREAIERYFGGNP